MVGIDLESAIDLLLANACSVKNVETVCLLDSLQRVCARDLTAPMNNPPFDRSPLDGYTFRSADTANALPDKAARFEIVGEVCAGQYFQQEVQSGQAVRIMTGGKIPAGCDCVVRQEDVTVEDDILYVPKVLQHHQNYCFCGEDIKKGTMLAQQGDVITAAHIGALASMGYSQVSVYARPRVAICSTGDELVDVGQPLTEGTIYNSNLYVLTARLRELGVEPVMLGIAGDDGAKVADLIRLHMDDVDLFLTTGGVSVGKKDIMHEVIEQLPAKRLFWRVCMKPGTPILSYTYKDKLGIALSGNPFAALATFELLVRPALAKISRKPQLSYERLQAVLRDDFPKQSQGRRFIRANYSHGEVRLPAQNHSSGSLFSAVGCNAMIDIPPGSPALTSGMKVEIVKL